MNNYNDIHPGKLKRKSKKSSSPSVVDLPGLKSQTPSSGNLLGDVVFDSSDALPAAETSPSADDIHFDEVFFKNDPEPETAPASPLDQLHVDDDPESTVADAVEEAAKARDSIAPHRLQRKTPKNKIPLVEDAPAPDFSKYNEILIQTRELNQKTVNTLATLQNNNIQNERRYALNLIIAFAVLGVLTVIGVFAGVNLKTDASTNEVRYKNEVCNNAIESRKIIEDEYEAEKRGSAAAFEVYQKIEQGLYEDAVEHFAAVRNKLTHPAETALLEAKIDEIRWKLAENAYHDGVMLYNASNYEQARDAFFKSLAHKENTSYSPRLNYYLAMSLYQLGDFEGARRYLSNINSSELSPEMDALARYYRGICAEKLGDETEAFEQFDQFIKKYRYHKLVDEAVKHRAKVESAKK